MLSRLMLSWFKAAAVHFAAQRGATNASAAPRRRGGCANCHRVPEAMQAVNMVVPLMANDVRGTATVGTACPCPRAVGEDAGEGSCNREGCFAHFRDSVYRT
jgi:hypothetical protein